VTTATRSLVAAGTPSRGARWRRKHLTLDKVSFAVVFLAAREASAVNGQAIVLDGGGIQA